MSGFAHGLSGDPKGLYAVTKKELFIWFQAKKSLGPPRNNLNQYQSSLFWLILDFPPMLLTSLLFIGENEPYFELFKRKF